MGVRLRRSRRNDSRSNRRDAARKGVKGAAAEAETGGVRTGDAVKKGGKKFSRRGDGTSEGRNLSGGSKAGYNAKSKKSPGSNNGVAWHDDGKKVNQEKKGKTTRLGGTKGPRVSPATTHKERNETKSRVESTAKNDKKKKRTRVEPHSVLNPVGEGKK